MASRLAKLACRTDAAEQIKMQPARCVLEKWEADFDGWAFLTGSASEIEAVTAQYAVYVANTDAGLAHTDTILLIDRHGQLRSVFGMQTDPQTILDRIRQLVQ